MKHYSRYLLLLAMTFFSMQAFAVDDIDRFSKKCDLFKDGDYNIKSWYRSRVKELVTANVPIKISFDRCDFIRYVIQLRNGSSTEIESGFPTNEDPDNKNSTYSWNPNSPSKNYWLFNEGGWEWAGWVLVEKTTGRRITSKTECANYEMRAMGDLLAVICSGAYENTIPTVYVVNFMKSNEVWSKPIPLQKCNEDSEFALRKFTFVNPTKLNIEGDCRLSTDRGNIRLLGKKWVKVKANIEIFEGNLIVKSESLVTKVDWKVAN